MTTDVVAFWALAVILVGSGLAVVLTKNVFHAVLWLALSLVGTAGVFLLLEAEYLAAVQLLLYAGGIITIVVFAIVVTERLVGQRLSQTTGRLAGGTIVSASLLVLLVRAVFGQPLAATRPPMADDLTRTLGEAMLTRYVLPFELLAFLMLAALLGATYFARPDE
jgi:NADH-quinone oxidoreductase subunit J